MKFQPGLLLATLCMMTVAINCSKADDFSSNYLRGKINGEPFECTSISANKPMPTPGSGDDPTIIIEGRWPHYYIKLNIYGEGGGAGSSISEGNYLFQAYRNRSATIWENDVDVYYAGNGGGLGVPAYLAGSGRITIAKIDKNYIKGTFEFITEVNGATTLSKAVTDGEFYIKRN